MSQTIRKKLKIEGMHCTSCALVINMDLEDLEGIKKAQISYAKQEAEIEFDSEKVTMEVIIETIRKSGYLAVTLD